MIRRCGILYLMVFLTASCSEPAESTAKEIAVTPDWTSAFNSNGFEEIALSSAMDLPDGRIVESGSIDYLNQTELDILQEMTIEEGQMRELRITIEKTGGIDLDSIYHELNDRLNALFGPAMPTKAYATWKAATSNQTLMEIELMDARHLFQRDEILIRWKEHADRLYED